MKCLATIVIILLLTWGAPAQAVGEGKPPPEPASSKEFFDEARGFLRAARASLEKWDRVPDQISGAVYYTGVKDGALGAMVAWLVVYIVLRQRKTP